MFKSEHPSTDAGIDVTTQNILGIYSMARLMSITEFRRSLAGLQRKPRRKHSAIALTHRGEKKFAVLPWDDYEAILETMEILRDRTLMRELRRNERELAEGKGIDLEVVKRRLER